MSFRTFSFRAFVVITLLFTSYWAYVAFHEWYTVGYSRHTAGYPWGPGKNYPWYYKNPAVFSRVMMVEFLLLAAGLGFALFRLVKRNRQSIFYGMLGLWFLMTLMLINAFM